jgi:splicing factor 3B subunit 3
MHLRTEYTSLCGRDHASFRSYYYPIKVSNYFLFSIFFCLRFNSFNLFYIKSVIDGDLCEKFSNLDSARQKTIAEELDRTPNEVLKRLEDIRTRFAF